MNYFIDTCQVDNSINSNTDKFWDKKIKQNRRRINKSPVFIHKNKLILKKIKNISGNILDIGFGYGYIEQLAQAQKLKISLFGIDISSEAVDFANKYFMGVYKKASIYKIPYRNGFFDCVLILDILEHLPANKLSLAFKEIQRVLDKGGTLIVSVPLNETKKDTYLNKHLRVYNPSQIKNDLKRYLFKVKDEKYLFAFKTNYLLKNLINKFVKIRVPNLIILTAIKK